MTVLWDRPRVRLPALHARETCIVVEWVTCVSAAPESAGSSWQQLKGKTPTTMQKAREENRGGFEAVVQYAAPRLLGARIRARRTAEPLMRHRVKRHRLPRHTTAPAVTLVGPTGHSTALRRLFLVEAKCPAKASSGVAALSNVEETREQL